MFEVELKARLNTGQIEEIEKVLKSTYKCSSEICVYQDTYFDTVSRDLDENERELRLRKTVTGQSKTVLLTYKEPPFDSISKSKPEHEILVNSHEQAAIILGHLGYVADISFQKHCTNFQVGYRSMGILVTLVRMKELNEDFIEVEVQTAEAEMITEIIDCLHEFLVLLNVMPEQLTTEYYTEMVRQVRNQ